MTKAYSIPDTAKMLAVSPRTIRRMVMDGQLGSVCLRGRRVIPAAAVERLLMGNTGTFGERITGDAARAQSR